MVSKTRHNQRGGNKIANKFVEDHHLLRLDSPGDGNCFFYSLETYFNLNHKKVSYSTLREKVVQYMRQHKDDLLPFFFNSNNPENELDEEFDKLSEFGAWDTVLGDFVPQIATSVFNIRIIVHNLKPNARTVDSTVLGDNLRAPVIHLLRTRNNHYDFLYPVAEIKADTMNIWNNLSEQREMEIASRKKTKGRTMKKPKTIHMANTMNMNMMSLNKSMKSMSMKKSKHDNNNSMNINNSPVAFQPTRRITRSMAKK
jgi:hypothetical protein